MASSNCLGISPLRVHPKQSGGLRPIVQLGRSAVPRDMWRSTYDNFPVNAKLINAFYILKSEVKKIVCVFNSSNYLRLDPARVQRGG